MKSTRPLLIAVIVMGVLVVLATGVVIVKVVQDIAGGGHRPAPGVASTIVPGEPQKITLTTQTLSQPEGSHITSIATAGDRLAVLINGGGPDRILFVDPETGTVTGQLMLGQ